MKVRMAVRSRGECSDIALSKIKWVAMDADKMIYAYESLPFSRFTVWDMRDGTPHFVGHNRDVKLYTADVLWRDSLREVV